MPASIAPQVVPAAQVPSDVASSEPDAPAKLVSAVDFAPPIMNFADTPSIETVPAIDVGGTV